MTGLFYNRLKRCCKRHVKGWVYWDNWRVCRSCGATQMSYNGEWVDMDAEQEVKS